MYPTSAVLQKLILQKLFSEEHKKSYSTLVVLLEFVYLASHSNDDWKQMPTEKANSAAKVGID